MVPTSIRRAIPDHTDANTTKPPPSIPAVNHSILIQGDDARREIAREAREALEAAVHEQGGKDPLGRVLEALEPQLGVLTLARVADLLGVTERTVTETYVAKTGLPVHRLHKTASPWFLMDEVVAWVRQQNGGAVAPEKTKAALTLVGKGQSSFITKEQWQLIRNRRSKAQSPATNAPTAGKLRACG